MVCGLVTLKKIKGGKFDMGKVAVSIKVSPKEGANLESIEAEIKKIKDVKDVTEENIGFGIKVIKVLVVIDDSSGGSQAIEDKISSVKGVDLVDVLDTTLI